MPTGQCQVDPVTEISGAIYTAYTVTYAAISGALATPVGSTERNQLAAMVQAIATGIDTALGGGGYGPWVRTDGSTPMLAPWNYGATDLYNVAKLSVGTATLPPTDGIGLTNLGFIRGRNLANSAWYALLWVDASNVVNVGDPSTFLQVSGSDTTVQASGYLTMVAGADAAVTAPAGVASLGGETDVLVLSPSGALTFSTAGTDRLRVANNGAILLGTATAGAGVGLHLANAYAIKGLYSGSYYDLLKMSGAGVATFGDAARASEYLGASHTFGSVPVTLGDAVADTQALTRGQFYARTITAGTGLSGGGDLSANRSFAVVYGTGAGTALEGSADALYVHIAGTESITGSKTFDANVYIPGGPGLGIWSKSGTDFNLVTQGTSFSFFSLSATLGYWYANGQLTIGGFNVDFGAGPMLVLSQGVSLRGVTVSGLNAYNLLSLDGADVSQIGHASVASSWNGLGLTLNGQGANAVTFKTNNTARMTLEGGAAALLLGTTTSLGADGVGLANDQQIAFRDAADANWVAALQLNGADLLAVGSGATTTTQVRSGGNVNIRSDGGDVNLWGFDAASQLRVTTGGVENAVLYEDGGLVVGPVAVAATTALGASGVGIDNGAHYYGMTSAGAWRKALGVTATNAIYIGDYANRTGIYLTGGLHLAYDEPTTSSLSAGGFTVIGADTRAGAVTLTLPAVASTLSGGSRMFLIFDNYANAAANNITVQRAGGDTVNGGASKKIQVNRGGLLLVSDEKSFWTAWTLTPA